MRNADRAVPALVSVLCLTLAGCVAEDGGTVAASDAGGNKVAAVPGDSVVVRWNEATVEAIRRSGQPPTALARNLAVVHTCMYDAWAAYDPAAAPSRPDGPPRRAEDERDPTSALTAISHAAYRAATDVFPKSREAVFDPLMRGLGHDPGAEPGPDSPAAVGNAACDAVLTFRHKDGANQLGDHPDGKRGVPYSDHTGYEPVNDPLDLTSARAGGNAKEPGRWQPLTYTDGTGNKVTPSFLTPQWAQVTPFALDSPREFRPQGPVAPGTRGFRDQARELLDLSAGLTDRQKVMARWWAAGPDNEFAPGQWSVFAAHVARRDGHGSAADGVGRDVRMFFVLANAIADAAIATWEAKVHFDSVRPLTAIRSLFGDDTVRAWAGPGKGTGAIAGAAWHPYHPTSLPSPPFGEYPAGHSAFGAAGAEALRLFTGNDKLGYSVTVPAGTSGFEPGVPAADVTFTWDTFSQAAADEGMSRLYGGVHFRRADSDGQQLGRAVAAKVWAKAQKLFEGSAG